MFQRFFNYFKDANREIRKVKWPTQRETVRFTLTVILVSVGVSLILGALDLFFKNLILIIIS